MNFIVIRLRRMVTLYKECGRNVDVTVCVFVRLLVKCLEQRHIYVLYKLVVLYILIITI